LLPRRARSAKRGITIVSRPSVCLSICLSVTLMYRWHMCWVCSKLIIISLQSSLLEPLHRQSSPRGTPPKFGWNRGEVGVLNRKPAISLKRGKIGPGLLLMANRKSYTRFRLVPKSTTFDDLEAIMQWRRHGGLGPPIARAQICFEYVLGTFKFHVVCPLPALQHPQT